MTNSFFYDPLKISIVGGYTVSLKIGYPGQSFDVFIDTGSDLTWV